MWMQMVATAFFFEPLYIVLSETVWASLIHSTAQAFGFGPFALSATLQYRDVVRQVENFFFKVLRVLAAIRVERWWRAVLDMYRGVHEQTKSAIKIQSRRKQQLAQKKYAVDRQWCLRITLRHCEGLEKVSLDGAMNPWLRIHCDPKEGNPEVIETKVCWAGDSNPVFEEQFHIDIKLVNGFYIEAWSKDVTNEQFIGRGYVEIKGALTKGIGMRSLSSGPLLTRLYDLNIGEVAKPDMKVRGAVFSVVSLLDPLKDNIPNTNWMLPRHRMQFVMSKLGAGTALGGLISNAKRNSEILEDTAEESKKDEKDATSPMEQVLPGQVDSASPPETSAPTDAERKSADGADPFKTE
jgi:hypothetical protein